jgi:hypothetical protein
MTMVEWHRDFSDVISDKILDLMDMRYLAARRSDWETFDRLTAAIDDEKRAAKMQFRIELETLGAEHGIHP